MFNRIFFLSLLILITTSITTFSQTIVSGTISGQHWTKDKSPYIVNGNIRVASLEIDPGVLVIFSGNFIFEIVGTLRAVGTQQDSIHFMKDAKVSGWQGIFFNFSSPGSKMAYCIIENSTNSGIRIENNTTKIFPEIRNCMISNNSSIRGGGICIIGKADIYNSSIIENMVSNSNGDGSSYSYGGGIYADGELNIYNCDVKKNKISVYASKFFEGHEAFAFGAGIYIKGNLNATCCKISDNYSTATVGHKYGSSRSYGGGLYAVGNILISNSIISKNKVFAIHTYIDPGWFAGSVIYEGGGIFLASGSGVMENCAFAYNDKWLYIAGDSAKIKNSIVYFNKPENYPLSGKVEINFSDVQGGFPGQGNININPVFYSEEDLIILDGSLCIDSGDPDHIYNDICLPPSLGTNRNDMGAHGGP